VGRMDCAEAFAAERAVSRRKHALNPVKDMCVRRFSGVIVSLQTRRVVPAYLCQKVA
jgi:hypothetical protein